MPSDPTLSFHEQRLQKAEERISDLETEVGAHIQTDELQHSIVSQKIDEMGDRIMGKIDELAEGVVALQKRSEAQAGSIASLRAKELKRSKITKLLANLPWVAAAAAATEVGHRILTYILGKHQ